MTESKTIRWEQDSDGIVVLTLDDPKQSANTMNADFRESFGVTIDRLEAEKDSITGVVITSAKKTFFAGGDLNDLIKATPADAEAITEYSNELKQQLRRLETLGRPVVAAINGAALGGGLEIALACHHRIAADVKGSRIGLPEVTLGLLPGAGGVVRTVRLLGIQNAVLNVLVQGQRYRPAKALEIGLIHELVDSVDELLPKAKEWIKANPEAQQPWDVKGYKIPGGTPSNPKFAANLPAFPATLRKQLKGAPMPAPRAILATAVESTQVDIDTAFKIETRYFVSLVTGQVAKNMTKAFFFDLQHINSGGSRPKGFEKYTARKVGVLGAGMMGAAIAYVAAKAGIDVVLKDVSKENAEKGKDYARKLEEKALKRGKTTEEKSKALLDRIVTTGDPADFAGVDFVIEAVFESTELKHKVFAEIEDIVNPDAVLGSNTSTLPITTLAEGVKRQEDFIGIHFFSPVDKMPLVEIIRGKKTSDATLAKVFDFTLQIRKTPIVVNDSRGFFTSRVIGTFLNEAVAALGEGVEPATIEQAGAQAGYPAPPLQLMDELTLTLPRKIREETKAAVEAAGGTWTPHPADAVIDRMIDEFDRKGRSFGAGFYEYDENGKRVRLWPGLREAWGSGSADVPFKDLQERMLFAEALETVKCFDEGVLNSVEDANIGSIFGIGFPAWTGGVVQYMNQYEGGLKGFVARARELAQRYGSHFEPPASLVEKAEKGEIFE
ncbi:3-hydroxyacyl-CoA dehydrogenase NAD-binding domain-containing protein [Saccharomonospora viridis]|jgi:3-hydroxyacyl-CoA dehydrogenase/enoyl-CoA hydratase/3-hydroxybutyryl-CoA epimerase|nr:3-hydroxyacyl-CoA dehydrogenase NAD-binding domain-containing protein [Saccharomonospora viridis]SFP38363.1 3-hydroxyacyl-CoA dehydrogenase / enoyl-CoA hydratase / 3-hydroxybutyryl-CoA epimerase [Saccharomonospora viridis]